MKKIFVCAAVIALSFASGVRAEEVKDPIMAVVAAKEAKAKPVSWCMHQEKKYNCGPKKIVVFRASGEISCRGLQDLVEKGERFCTSQTMD